MKNDSLFNYGMRPVILSRIKSENLEHKINNNNKEEKEFWQRGCSNIIYFKNNINRESGHNSYYTLSFQYKFEYSNDKVYFAHCMPYTYTKLVKYLDKLSND